MQSEFNSVYNKRIKNDPLKHAKLNRGKVPSLFFLWQQALHSCIVYNIELPTFIYFFVCLFVFPMVCSFVFCFLVFFPFSCICELVQEC